MPLSSSKNSEHFSAQNKMTDSTPLLSEPPSENSILRPKPTRKKSKHRKPHEEKHGDGDDHDLLKNIIIGFADGLTVPFALTAGLSSYVLATGSLPAI